MTEPKLVDTSSEAPATDQSELLRIFEKLTDLMLAGEQQQYADLIEQYPQYADELESALPAIEIMHDVKSSDDADFGHTSDQVESPVSIKGQLGDFRLIREIGRGGMGIVYEAEQISLRRKVALKVLPFAGMLDPRQIARFENEARAAATVHHTNIVPIHFVGSDRNVYFYAMQLIDGVSLAEALREMQGQRTEEGGQDASGIRSPSSDAGESPPNDGDHQDTNDTSPIAYLSTARSTSPKDLFRTVANIGVQIADALQHAHEQGVTHRDVKPANILIDSGGKPWITDFGLARIATDPGMTASGDLLGTLRYMSPEQVLDNQTVDHRTDIYSLGATLYETVALRPARDASSREALLKQITDGRVKPPRTVAPNCPTDLETIVHKALEFDPDDRYDSANALATDLQRYLDDQPIQARRPSTLTLSRKWIRRHPTFMVAAVVVLFVCLGTSLVATGIAQAGKQEASEALDEKEIALGEKEAALRRAEANLEIALSAVDDLYLELGMRWIADDSAPTGLQSLFLDRARRVYASVADQPIKTNKDRARAAKALERIAQIDRYRHLIEPATEAVERAIALGEELSAQAPTDVQLHADQLRRYRLQADLQMLRSDFVAAEKSFAEGQKHLAAIEEHAAEPHDFMLERAQFNQGRAALLLRQDELQTAESLLRATAEYLDSLPKKLGSSAGHHLTKLSNRLLLAEVLQSAGQLTAAETEAEKGLEQSQSLQSWSLSDDRQAAILTANFLRLRGELVEAQDELEQAADYYRQSLDIRRGTLHGKKEPSMLMVTHLGQGNDGLWEPGPFCDYIETNLRLARVLQKLGRPYEAEYGLGRCMLATIVIVADKPNVLRYNVAEANTWALIWQLLREERSSEADEALDYAILIWRETLSNFPEATKYESGVHGKQTDLAWFRSILDNKGIAKLDSDAPLPVHEVMRWYPGIALAAHASGRSWYDAGGYQQAIHYLKQSAEARDEDHAYPWLHIAIAHAKLGNQDEATEWLEKAEAAIGDLPRPAAELIELRVEVREMLRPEIPSDNE